MRLVSFVVPTLKEGEIGAALLRLSTYLSGSVSGASGIASGTAAGSVVRLAGFDFEVLLADDSPDAWKPALDEAIAANDARFAPRITTRRIDAPRKGKGAALRDGVRASRGEIVFTMDADLPVPLEEIEAFIRLVDEGNDVVIGERPFDRNIKEPVRFVASRVLLALQQALVFQSRAFTDTQCGFKAFRGPCVRRFAEQQVVDGGMVDIEYLYAAVRSGARYARVDVIPNPETRASRINVKRALWMDPLDLIRIKLRGLTGSYRAP